VLGVHTLAQTTQPAPGSRALPAEQVLDRMLSSPTQAPVRTLQPVQEPNVVDRSTGDGSTAPGARQLSVLREGTFLVDRTGRLARSGDGHHWELVFEADGKALKDPPMILLPNLKLMAMETAVKNATRDVRFRVTGMVTEYNGRNYLLLEKVVVVPDSQRL
jgi:hypothetical protein